MRKHTARQRCGRCRPERACTSASSSSQSSIPATITVSASAARAAASTAALAGWPRTHRNVHASASTLPMPVAPSLLPAPAPPEPDCGLLRPASAAHIPAASTGGAAASRVAGDAVALRASPSRPLGDARVSRVLDGDIVASRTPGGAATGVSLMTATEPPGGIAMHSARRADVATGPKAVTTRARARTSCVRLGRCQVQGTSSSLRACRLGRSREGSFRYAQDQFRVPISEHEQNKFADAR